MVHIDEISLKAKFPVITEPELWHEIMDKGQLMRVSEGTAIIEIGSYIKTVPLVISGAIKVSREDDQGNELFLYYLYPGQTCAMSLNCCMANRPSEVKAVAEEQVEFIALPVEVMDRWMVEYQGWKNFIMQTYSERFNELLNTIDSIAFRQLDERLWQYLQNKSSAMGKATIPVTHQQIAYDLNSSREVISRLLKQLERQEKIELSRNSIRVV